MRGSGTWEGEWLRIEGGVGFALTAEGGVGEGVAASAATGGAAEGGAAAQVSSRHVVPGPVARVQAALHQRLCLYVCGAHHLRLVLQKSLPSLKPPTTRPKNMCLTLATELLGDPGLSP